jgi:hypothetical protein
MGAVALSDRFYHWSPGPRFKKIRSEGLKPYSKSLASDDIPKDIGGPVTWPYVCLGTTPAQAWRLSGDMGWGAEEIHWDLWEVRLTDDDEVHFMAEWGPNLKELRVSNPIPAERLWWVGRREQPSAEPSE